jgi:hypothetical protein
MRIAGTTARGIAVLGIWPSDLIVRQDQSTGCYPIASAGEWGLLPPATWHPRTSTVAHGIIIDRDLPSAGNSGVAHLCGTGFHMDF